MKDKTRNMLTSWFNNHVECAIKERFGEDDPVPIQEQIERRKRITESPKEVIFIILRDRAQHTLGVGSPEESFPLIIRSMVLQYVANEILNGKTLTEVIGPHCSLEEDTDAIFPQMLAAFGTKWLCYQNRWRTRKFKHLR